MYQESSDKFPFPAECLYRVPTPSHNVGNTMCKWILRVDGKIVPRSTVHSLTHDEDLSPIIHAKQIAFTNSIRDKLGDSVAPSPKPPPIDYKPYEDNNEIPHKIPDLDHEEYDYLINAEALLPHNDKTMHATVLGPLKDAAGKEKGRYDSNPILNTRVYEVMFPDGAMKEYTANIIAENMWAGVDQEGHQY